MDENRKRQAEFRIRHRVAGGKWKVAILIGEGRTDEELIADVTEAADDLYGVGDWHFVKGSI